MAKKVHAVGVIFENEQGQMLVLKRQPNNPEGNAWGLVGGKIDGDESAVNTAARKTFAETGLTVDPADFEYVKTYHWNRDDLDITFEVFRLKVASGLPITIDPAGSSEYTWSNPEALYKQPDLMVGLYPILEDVYQPNIS